MEITHRIEPTTKMTAACSPDGNRYATDHVLATPAGDGQAYLAATDSYQCTIIKANAPMMPNEELIPAKAFPQKMSGKKIKHIELNGMWRNSEGSIQPTSEANRFPRPDDMFPAVDCAEPGEYIPVTFDIEHLVKMCKASGATTVTMLLTPDSKYPRMRPEQIPVILKDSEDEFYPKVVGFGIVMPRNVPESSINESRNEFAEMVRGYQAAREAAVKSGTDWDGRRIEKLRKAVKGKVSP